MKTLLPISAAALLSVGLVTGAKAQHFTQGYFNQAEKLFQRRNYYEASQCYEKYLSAEKKYRPVAEPFSVSKKHKGRARLDPHREAIYHLAESYRQINDYPKAERYYAQSIKFPVSDYPAARYWYAVSLRANQKYPEALKALNDFYEHHERLDAALIGADREMDNLKFISAQKDRTRDEFAVADLSDSLEKSVYALSVQHGDTVVYTKVQPSTDPAGKEFFQAALFRATDPVNPLSAAEPVAGVDAPGEHTGIASFSPDGSRMFFTRWTKADGRVHSSIWTSVRAGSGWSAPVQMPEPVNIPNANSAQPSVTGDGRYLLFVSDREGGLGGFDIWYASLDKQYQALQVQNMGNVINTTGDEYSPFFHEASRTLVFATNGRVGMGGFDIFYSKGNYNLTSWDAPSNPGSPVNSPRDDMYYVSTDPDHLWNTGWLSSDRNSECCLALFSVKQNNAQYISGNVVQCGSHQGLAGVELIVTDKRNAVIGKFKTDSSGNYMITLHNTAHFNISLRKDGFEPKTTEYQMGLDKLSDTLQNDAVCLENIQDNLNKAGLKKALAALSRRSTVGNFEYKKADLNPAAFENLDSLADLMRRYPTIRIQVEGYTDGIGSAAYNKRLAQQRVDACVNYLVGKGIDRGRLVGKAMGECCPIAPERINGKDNPAGREKNRRVEYKLLSMGTE